MPLNAIVCVNEKNGIGHQGCIPWKSREDMRYFRKMTIGNGNNAIVMGSKTFKSLGYKPLPQRKNYVITHDPPSLMQKTRDKGNDIVFESQISNILLLPFIFDDVFIIGGESIYKIFESHYNHIYVTYINNHAFCDTFFTVDLTRFYPSISRTVEDDKHTLRFVDFINLQREKQENGDIEMAQIEQI
jgi:dihydrofolate reductase